MSEEEIEYMISCLSITVERKTEFGPTEMIEVKLFYGDKEISSGDCSIDTESLFI